jgi:hypothetical protein
VNIYRRRGLAVLLIGLVPLLVPGSATVATGGVTIGAPGSAFEPDLAERPGAEPDEESGEAPGPAGADHWFVAQRTYPFRTLDIGRLHRSALARAATISAKPRLRTADAWQSLGPANIGGRVTDLAADPTRTDTVYAAAATGGVWKSTDAGRTFVSAWDPTLTPSIGALAITDSGVLYAGTGEGNPGGGSVTFPGNGVYRSTDGGTSWTHLGLAGTDRIGRLAIDPTNSNRIFAAATGSLFVPGGPRGLYRTTDGGASWQQVLPGVNGTTGAVDVAIDPANPNRVYAAMWDHQRRPVGRRYGGVGSGLYRSTDGGTTWTRLAGGLPAASANLGRMGIAVARNDPSRVYAIAADTDGAFLGFWTSTNSGNSWTRITNTSFLSDSQSSYGWWFGRIWVDPAASQHIWVAGVSMLESTNAGSTWRRSFAFHADQHAMAWDPRSSGRVYLGNDGGVYRSQNGGSLTGTWTHTSSLAINQFYSVAVSPADTSRVTGGAQDNGALRSWGNPSWNPIGGGDGTTTLIDPTNRDKVYACSQYGACSRSTDGGNTSTGFGATVSERRNWTTPVVFDPSHPAIMYYGGNRLNRSTNSAASWTAISPDLTRQIPATGGATFSTITTVAVARSDGRVIYAGTDDGRVWVTRNTGGTWTEITAGLPTRWITRLAVDPGDANIAYVSVSGYTNGDPAAHVFRTTTGGTAWQDISGDLPDAPVNDLVLDPRDAGTVFVASDVGVFSATATGGSWSRVGDGLPAVPVADLEATPAGTATVLTAATFGLGMYRTTLP